ncbi:MAG TPA: hypothetical protein VGK19_10205 [Capsulimonadaceae bacterium]
MPLNLPQELDRLASELMEYAREGLSREGELYPIGAAITPEQEVQWCAIADDAHELSDVSVADELESLVNGMSADARAGRFVATGVLCQAIVVPPEGQNKVDAVELRLDHRSGDSVRVFVPYALDSGGVSFQRLFTSEGDASMFHQGLIRIQNTNA